MYLIPYSIGLLLIFICVKTDFTSVFTFWAVKLQGNKCLCKSSCGLLLCRLHPDILRHFEEYITSLLSTQMKWNLLHLKRNKISYKMTSICCRMFGAFWNTLLQQQINKQDKCNSSIIVDISFENATITL